MLLVFDLLKWIGSEESFGSFVRKLSNTGHAKKKKKNTNSNSHLLSIELNVSN